MVSPAFFAPLRSTTVATPFAVVAVTPTDAPSFTSSVTASPTLSEEAYALMGHSKIMSGKILSQSTVPSLPALL